MSRGLNNPPRKVGKRKIKGTCLQGSWMVAILRTANCVEQVGQMSQFSWMVTCEQRSNDREEEDQGDLLAG